MKTDSEISTIKCREKYEGGSTWNFIIVAV